MIREMRVGNMVIVAKGILGQIGKGEDEKEEKKENMAIRMGRSGRGKILDLLMKKKTSVLIEIGAKKVREFLLIMMVRIGREKNVLDPLMKKMSSIPIEIEGVNEREFMTVMMMVRIGGEKKVQDLLMKMMTSLPIGIEGMKEIKFVMVKMIPRLGGKIHRRKVLNLLIGQKKRGEPRGTGGEGGIEVIGRTLDIGIGIMVSSGKTIGIEIGTGGIIHVMVLMMMIAEEGPIEIQSVRIEVIGKTMIISQAVETEMIIALRRKRKEKSSRNNQLFSKPT